MTELLAAGPGPAAGEGMSLADIQHIIDLQSQALAQAQVALEQVR